MDYGLKKSLELLNKGHIYKLLGFFLCYWFLCRSFFLFFECRWNLFNDNFLHINKREFLDLVQVSDLFASSLQIDVLFSELDIGTIATILNRDFLFWPVMNIAIRFLIDLRRDEFLSFF